MKIAAMFPEPRTGASRTAFAAIVLGAGLVLSACGGGDDATPAEGEQDAAPQEETVQEDAVEAPAAEADLVTALEAAGYAAQPMDASEFAEAQNALGDMQVDPAECEGVMGTGIADLQDSDITIVSGMPADPAAEPIAAAMGYPSADEAAATLDQSRSTLASCGDVTVTMQDTELSSSTSEVSAEVEGADTVHATESTIDMSGQEIATRSLLVQKGSALVSISASEAPGMEGTDFDGLSEKAAEVLAALP